jgi:hypothetical protein
MKIKTILLAFFLTLISVSRTIAQPSEPCPSGNCDEQLPGAPIDQNIIYLLIGAVVLGFVIINKNKIKKASV